MDDTNVKLTIDLGQKVLEQFTKLSTRITIDLGPNMMTAIKYMAGSFLIYKSIDSITQIITSKKK